MTVEFDQNYMTWFDDGYSAFVFSSLVTITVETNCTVSNG
jgi:hypothetical protein